MKCGKTNMTELVTINGIILSIQQYMKIGDKIIFYEAPELGSGISIISEAQRLDYKGDGFTCTFPWPQNDKALFKQFMDSVYENRNNPTVKDQLEKLKIVMELIR
jgi:hypothetical protein